MVASLAHEQQVDVVIVAECSIADSELLTTLRQTTGQKFRHPKSIASKIRIFSRLPQNAIRPAFDDLSGRLTIREIVTGNRSFLLAAVHFPSKVHWSDEGQQAETQILARHIDQTETDRGHRRTVLVGDLNMNPFESGVVSSHGLHGVMTQEIARQASHTVAGREYPFFYNPMWGLFGDRTDGPPGTHFFRKARPLMYFWNMFDQVLIRPGLLDEFEGVRILDACGATSLTTSRGLPDESVGSDHLPILFELNL